MKLIRAEETATTYRRSLVIAAEAAQIAPADDKQSHPPSGWDPFEVWSTRISNSYARLQAGRRTPSTSQPLAVEQVV